MTIRRISITFVAVLFATISFGQVKSIDERIGEAMNSSNWAELSLCICLMVKTCRHHF